MRFLAVLFLLFLVSCSSTETKDSPLEALAEADGSKAKVEMASVPSPEPVPSVSEAKFDDKNTKKEASEGKTKEKGKAEKSAKTVTEEKEPGSLWSAGSHWNAIFSLRTFRREGDSFLVLPTEAFRNKLSKLVADAKKDERGTAQFDERNFILTLRESEEGGTFKVAGSYNFLFAGEPVVVQMEGRVREREIRDDDSISSDGLIDAEFKVVGADTKKKTEKDKDAKEATSEASESAKADKDGGEKEKVVETVKDPNTDAAKKKRRAIEKFEKQKSGTKVAATNDEKEEKSEEN